MKNTNKYLYADNELSTQKLIIKEKIKKKYRENK